MNRRTILGAALILPAASYACEQPHETPVAPAAAPSGPSGTITGQDSLTLALPDAPTVRVRLWDYAPQYPGDNGGRIDMRTSGDGATLDAADGDYSWAFSEIYDHRAILHGASASDHSMTDQVRLSTAIGKDDGAGAEFELLFSNPHGTTRQKLWRWVGTTVYLDGRVCGYQGHAVRRSVTPIRAITLWPDVGTFSMSYQVLEV